MINLSLESGCFPESWKHADIHPRLKKPKSEATFPNLRPISNLTFVSKLAERVVSNQTHNHLTLNCLYLKAQCSYREFHSTETALLRIKNDILMNMNKQHLTLLVLIDLTAAFDTVDHVILLNRLNSNFCISGLVLLLLTQLCLLMEKHPGCLTLSMVFLEGPVLALSSSFCMSVSYSLSTTCNSILPSNLSLNMRLMLSQLCKRALLI